MLRGGCLVLGALVTWLACSASDRLPENLLGVWRHPDPAYADRTLEVRPDHVVFGTGSGGHRRYAISRIDAEPAGAATAYTIEYRQESGDRVPLRLEFTPGPVPELRLGRRPGVWRLDPTTPPRRSEPS